MYKYAAQKAIELDKGKGNLESMVDALKAINKPERVALSLRRTSPPDEASIVEALKRGNGVLTSHAAKVTEWSKLTDDRLDY